MTQKTQIYKDEPLGTLDIISDFLPPPEALALKEECIKVTLALSKKSIDFFKKAASQASSPKQYQSMIRDLLDRYTEHFVSRE